LASDSSTASWARCGFLFRVASQIKRMMMRRMTIGTIQLLPDDEPPPVYTTVVERPDDP
jgi:hypothetical protein